MSVLMRATIAILLTLTSAFAAVAADKPYHRDDLADTAIRLEGEIKANAGTVGKPPAALRRDADAALARNDARAAVQVLGQIVTVAPADSASWLRLARATLQLRSANPNERAALLDRAATAAYIAYQRSGNRGEEADALVVLGRTYAERALWRPALDALRLSLDQREAADVRASYEKMREDHGFRLLDYAVDSDSTRRARASSSPRNCRASVPISRRSWRWRARTSRRCRWTKSSCASRAFGTASAMPSRCAPACPRRVRETLAKAADFSIFVRDRSPLARFTSKAYVLPRTGQRGIPVVSVNTPTVAIKVYRIGDRNLLDTVVGENFQRSLSRYELEQLASERGVAVWNGELKVESPLNAEVTTAFPVDEAIGTLSPGVYVMSAEAAGAKSDDFGDLATQWFIVSDLG